jgi:hypothetical protein
MAECAVLDSLRGRAILLDPRLLVRLPVRTEVLEVGLSLNVVVQVVVCGSTSAFGRVKSA